jgi:hypothetical protein
VAGGRIVLRAVRLCSRHVSCAERISDEYDVQDLLRSLLRLHFDDVRRRNGTRATAAHSPGQTSCSNPSAWSSKPR